eukprot:Hpha_TRINITY_DN16379_c1_g1::TRINITY_DN16379_c1_g1_i6::g.61674::m.61674
MAQNDAMLQTMQAMQNMMQQMVQQQQQAAPVAPPPSLPPLGPSGQGSAPPPRSPATRVPRTTASKPSPKPSTPQAPRAKVQVPDAARPSKRKRDEAPAVAAAAPKRQAQEPSAALAEAELSELGLVDEDDSDDGAIPPDCVAWLPLKRDVKRHIVDFCHSKWGSRSKDEWREELSRVGYVPEEVNAKSLRKIYGIFSLKGKRDALSENQTAKKEALKALPEIKRRLLEMRGGN